MIKLIYYIFLTHRKKRHMFPLIRYIRCRY